MTKPKSINFSRPLMDGSVARTNDQKERHAKKTASSKMINLQGIDLLSFLTFLIILIQRLTMARPRRITNREILAKGTTCKLANNHIMYDAMRIPITFEKI